MRRTIVALAALALTLTGCTSKPQNAPQSVPQPAVSPAVTHAAKQGREPVTYRFPDCEDVETSDSNNLPCITFDENEWRVVTSYKPYRAHSFPVCDVEDYPTFLPCVLVHKGRDGLFTLLTADEIFD